MQIAELERTATLLDQDESLVYRLGDTVWKVYPNLLLSTIKRYQIITARAAAFLDGRAVDFKLGDTPRSIIQRFNLFVTPIQEVLEVDGKPCTVSEFIPGHSLLHTMYLDDLGGESTHPLRLITKKSRTEIPDVLTRLRTELNQGLNTAYIDLNELNIKVRDSDLIVTDLYSEVWRVDQE